MLEKLDVAAVCNNNGARAGAVLECVNRKLHVVAEKPLSINRPDLERIKAAVARQNVELSMLISMRYRAVVCRSAPDCGFRGNRRSGADFVAEVV